MCLKHSSEHLKVLNAPQSGLHHPLFRPIEVLLHGYLPQPRSWWPEKPALTFCTHPEFAARRNSPSLRPGLVLRSERWEV